MGWYVLNEDEIITTINISCSLEFHLTSNFEFDKLHGICNDMA